ncbi:macrophage migration inhibitory factor-like [Haliotis rufescens]|uniref:macrophage migration inhibitory factor-like n=1 Tax=Haliotis rufescens TaxID=6454 RepID=UPI001EB09532|nr:macrophage migration inhibitory factor-like [Haliotis rufescens]
MLGYDCTGVFTIKGKFRSRNMQIVLWQWCNAKSSLSQSVIAHQKFHNIALDLSSEDSGVCMQKSLCLGVSVTMPVFLLFTNLPASAIPKGFLLETTKMISKTLRKPEERIAVLIHPDQMMSHGGTTDLCANSELQGITNMGNKENIQMSKDISEFLQQKLGIDPKRNYIKFTRNQAFEVGYKGTTFEVLWK